MKEVLAELELALDAGRPCVFCTVVETRGSTPQKAGAAMLVLADGGQRGTLGGGCVEAEVRQRALGLLTSSGQPQLLSFCLDDNYGWDDGLICGGRMNVLTDPIGLPASVPSALAYYRRLRELVTGGHGCTEAVPLEGSVGQRLLFDANGRLVARRDDQPVTSDLAPLLRPLANRPFPWTGGGTAFLPVLPRVTLLIVGAGHVGQAVARLASEVDFDVWVADDRERYASAERFPTAQRRLVGDLGATLKALAREGIGPATYCLIVTRGHDHDEEALFHLAPTSASYVGMIGSRRKIKLIYEDLIAKGIEPATLDRVHAPLGFSIGSRTVPEIAISIVAELIACRNLGTTVPKPRNRPRAETTGS
jgi:xanthine dehydrogenase accessory factor